MRALNLRLGFATNSSSSHSIVVLSHGIVAPTVERDPSIASNFGEDMFVLQDPDSKRAYLAALVAHALSEQDIPYSIATNLVADWFDLPGRKDPDWCGVSVDGQTALQFPLMQHVPPAFLSDMLAMIQHPQVVVLSGIEVEDIDPLARDVFPLPIGKIGPMAGRMRKDGPVWTIFDREYGHKVRLHTDVLADMSSYTHSTQPELVDLKITNWCPFGCSFCYQESTTRGQHADVATIDAILADLAALDVFEVAIGGGEPTMHPDFAHILKRVHDLGMVPNFTTFSQKWLHQPDIMDAVLSYSGAIGVSVHGLKDLDRLATIEQTLRQEHYARRAKGGSRREPPTVLAQHVLGSLSVEDTVALIEACAAQYTPLLLLGYKDTGFGQGHARTDFSNEAARTLLVETIRSSQIALSVDTAICADLPELVSQVETSPILKTGAEGMFSCYIDAVTRTMGPSSYAPDQMDPLPQDRAAMLDRYQGYSRCQNTAGEAA